MTAADPLPRLEALAQGNDLVRTGQSSAGEYAAWAGEPIIACYCRQAPATLLQQIGAEVREARGFADLTLIQMQDHGVYFDRRPGSGASPVQSWLEMASGGKREKEVAGQIRNLLLNGTGATLWMTSCSARAF